MSSLRKMMPGKKRGMGTGTKIMLMALPVVVYMAGKMIGARMEDNDEEW